MHRAEELEVARQQLRGGVAVPQLAVVAEAPRVQLTSVGGERERVRLARRHEGARAPLLRARARFRLGDRVGVGVRVRVRVLNPNPNPNPTPRPRLELLDQLRPEEASVIPAAEPAAAAVAPRIDIAGLVRVGVRVRGRGEGEGEG